MNIKFRKTILIIAAIGATLYVLYKGASLMAPGSYPYAESYEFKAPENVVIDSIKQFKKRHPALDNTYFKSSEGRSDSSYWYYNYYILTNGKAVMTWTRPCDNGNTELALVSVYETSTRSWMDFNDDLNKSDNERLKKLFEEDVLRKLGIPYKKRNE